MGDSSYITDSAVEQRLNQIGAFLDANENEKARKAWDSTWNVYEYWCATPEDREGSKKDLEERLVKLEAYVSKAKMTRKAVTKKSVVKVSVELDWYKVEDALVKYIQQRFHENGFQCDVDDISIEQGGVFSSVIYLYNGNGETAKLVFKDTLEAKCHWADAKAVTVNEAIKVGKSRLDEEIYNIVKSLVKKSKLNSYKKVYKTDILEVYKAMAKGSRNPFENFSKKFEYEVVKALEVTMTPTIARLRGTKTFNSPNEMKKFYLEEKNQAKFLDYLKIAGFEFSERGKKS